METSFFKSGKWVVAPSGMWARDNALGREIARETLERMSAEQVPAMLYHLVAAMPTDENFKGIAVGFFHGIASMAVFGHEVDGGSPGDFEEGDF